MVLATRLPGALEHHWEWQLHAACRDHDTRLFFHPPGERTAARAEREQEAKAVCATCPVRRECLLFALEARERYGVWGGTGERERLDIIAPAHRGRRTVRTGTAAA
ncbi:WhiB family transcriptional regulator [Kitasatospora sp. NPDC057223]|uniref:WhiB family transcriptional regulator n=1 Tax=Kitasatospora sp. NPDC057223 TaxID=3346055 RepID=UPI00363B7EA5